MIDPPTKPCPFCGSKAVIVGEALPPRRYWVSCIRKVCRSRGPRRAKMRAAVTAWNERR